MSRPSSLMAQAEAIKKAKVLMVGSGGIGCELLKTLVLTGFKDIEVIDMDTIEVSNLNRQFLFRKRHVGQSKAQVAREAVLKFKPDVNILAHHANVKETKFDVDYFKQFNLVLNGLDNLDARRHVNRLCLAANVPLVESGTTGYLGQVTVHIRGLTECYECQPKPAPKSYPVCTITSTPSKPVHCIVWAKDLLFTKLFGDRGVPNDLDVRSSGAEASFEQEETKIFELQNGETSKAFACKVFDHVFGRNIEIALKNEEAWKERRKPNPLYLLDVLPLVEEGKFLNGTTHEDVTKDDHSLSVTSCLGLKDTQQVWTLKESAQVFLETVQWFLEKRSQEVGSLVFDKDDQIALEFVTASANLRAHSFGIQEQSIFEAKGIAGNIVHAIATTNAIIAGLIVLEAIKILSDQLDKCRMTYCLEHQSKKLLLMPVEPFEPNPQCYVCSETPLMLEVNTFTATLRDVLNKIVKGKLGVSCPIVMQGSSLIFETGADLEEDMVAHYAANLEKKLAAFPRPITNGVVLTVEDLQQEFRCSLHVKHRDEFDEDNADAMLLSGDIATVCKVDTTVSDSLPKQTEEPLEVLNDDVDVVVMTDEPCAIGTKRKLDEDTRDGLKKRPKL